MSSNLIDVYFYFDTENGPDFEKMQTVPTLNDSHNRFCSERAEFFLDFKYLISSNAGDNSVVIFSIDPITHLERYSPADQRRVSQDAALS